MSNKKLVLLALVAGFSIFLGGILGTIDFFGLLNGNFTVNISLFLLASVLVYFITVFVFLLDFADKKNLMKAYLLIAFFFGLTLFFATANSILSLLASIVYYWFLHFTYKRSLNRQEMYVKFLPSEIFLPVLKQSLLYLIILFSVITLIQAQKKVAANKLISSSLLSTLVKPLSYGLNQQLNSQISSQLDNQTLPEGVSQKQVVQLVLKQTIEEMKKNKQNFVGLNPEDIPIEKTAVSNDGKIDITPVVDSLRPQIAKLLNNKIVQFKYLVPFVVAIVVFFLLKPIFALFGYIEIVLTLLLFKILISSGFAKIEKKQMEVERVSI